MRFTLTDVHLKRMDDNQDWRGYYCAVPINQLPNELLNWIEGVNPRSFRNSQTASNIRNTLVENPERFLLRNKGILLSAESVTYDPKTDVATIELTNSDLHGIADGGTTFRVIKELELPESPAVVRMEILVGIKDRDMLNDVVEARNDNVRIREVSVLNHKGVFTNIKKVLKEYGDRVAYEENGNGDIAIVDVIGTLVASTDVFGDHPVIAYSTASKALQEYEKNKAQYDSHMGELLELLEFHDDIYEWVAGLFKHKYGDTLEDMGVKRTTKPMELPFNKKKTGYVVPRGYVLPVVAAFRSCKDRSETFKKVQGKLGTELKALIFEAKSPNKFGKSRANWSALYGIVNSA